MDVGTDAVRLALVEREGRDFVVRWVHEESLTALQGFTDYDSVSSLLRRALQGRLDKHVDVATVPPWSSARVTVQEFPAMDEARFAKASVWHYQRNRVDDMDRPLHHSVAQETRTRPDGTEVMDGVMVSMDQVMLEGLEGMCSELHLRLRSVMPRPLCLVPLVEAQFGKRHAVLNVDIGSGQTRLALVVDGNVRLVRRIKPCANDVVRHICDTVGLNWEEANHALLAHSGWGPLHEDDPEGIATRAKAEAEKALDRLAKALIGEIERSIAYVEARHATPVDQVCLSGGLAGSSYLVDTLAAAIDDEVLRLDPFAGCSGKPEVEEPARTHYSLAIGAARLALSGAGARNILRSQSDVRSPARGRTHSGGWPRRRAIAAMVATGLLLGVGAHDVLQSRRLHRLHANEVRSQQRLARLSAEADSLGNQRGLFDLADRIEALRDLYAQRQLYTPFLSRVVRSLPSEIWLTQLSLAEVTEAAPESGEAQVPDRVPTIGHRLRIVGRSLEVDPIGQVVLDLERSHAIDRIDALKIDELKDAESGTAGFRFHIEGSPILATEETPSRPLPVPEVAR
jgi:hypothetical protein